MQNFCESLWLFNSITSNASGAYLLFSLIFNSSPWPSFLTTIAWAALIRCATFASRTAFLDFLVVGIVHLISSLLHRNWVIIAALSLNGILFLFLNVVALMNPQAPLGPNTPPSAQPLIIFAAGHVYLIRSALWAIGGKEDSARTNQVLIALFLISFSIHCLLVHFHLDLRRRRRRPVMAARGGEGTIARELRSIARVW